MSHCCACLFSILMLLIVSNGLTQAANPPNVVVILTDDQGWGDLSGHGNTNLQTPNLDSLAADGASFESFYVCHVCAPTRAEFLTGRYYPRTGVSGVSRGQGRLNADEVTIARTFDDAGYATGCFGKWHNGTQPPLHPNHQGFDEFYGFTSGHWGHYFSPPLDHNGSTVRGKGFIVDDCTNHAIEFIRENKARPFFCYVPLNTPHSPMMVPDRFYDKFADADLHLKHRDPQKEDIMMTRAALALVENIDWNVGRLLRALEEWNLADDTIVVFFCDNGPNSFRWNGGMKGRKGSIDEGGLRSPLFIRWPNEIRHKRIKEIAGAIDLLPTLSDLCGIPLATGKPLDGVSLKPLLLGEAGSWPDRCLFSMRRDEVSVRNQRFRLDAGGRLFDIASDRGQTWDVTAVFPERVKQLRTLAGEHREAMQNDLRRFADRPFHVGYAASTTLPARDGVESGTIQRSSKAPNNSFFKHWTDEGDAITWDVDILTEGTYEVIVYYTCAEANVGVRIQCDCVAVAAGEIVASTAASVTTAFDPPLYDKPKERVTKSHYFVKDFQPLSLGKFSLPQGRATLKLSASEFRGEQAIDVHSIRLVR